MTPRPGQRSSSHPPGGRAAACPAPALGAALAVAVAAVLACTAGRPVKPEAVSLLGQPLVPARLEPETRHELEANLEEARRRHEQDPDSEEGFIWLGRRLAYLGRYREAVAVYGRGLEIHPDSHRLLRHRGHRFITLRRLDDAVADLSRAAELIRGLEDEVEPDGAPNRFHIPRSTTHSNIHYHLGLAHYLRGDLESALEAYRLGLEFSRVNDDMLCATSHWTWMTLRRLGRDAEAQAILEPIREEMEILENDGYHQLLLMYRGERRPGDLLAAAEEEGIGFATVAYGVGNWYRLQGDEERARQIFRRIVAAGTWPAFGHIAAEAELAAAR